jgi:Protein of unknown function (DUF3105)
MLTEVRRRRGRLGVVLEWTAIIVAALAIAFGLIAVLSGFFAGRDQAGVSGSGSVPGASFRDLGDDQLSRGQPHPAYDSNPPTSGAHVPESVSADGLVLNNDQLLQALALGNVVFMYGSSTPPQGLKALADSVAGPFSASLAASGEAVILARRPGIPGIVGIAWTHLVQVSGANDPLLRSFASYWLGRGATGR